VNVKEYISSGIVESYVLGLLADSERLEFEAICAQYPEVAEARDQFELTLEATLLQDAAPPPPFVKEKLLQAVKVAGGVSGVDEEEQRAPVVQINWWKWIAAASVVLLAASVLWGINTNKKYQQAQDLAQENTLLQTRLDSAEQQLSELTMVATTLQKPEIKAASLQGTPVSPASFANVYWDTTSKDVYLLINNMPTPATDKQYQLWAMLNGKPVDLGVIDSRVWQQKLMIKMKGVDKAQAFAITLEPRGGSVNPTMEQMYVVGKM